MRAEKDQNVTELLLAWGDGNEEALSHLMPLVYRELHRLAARYMRGERPDHTLQTTALVNEAYLKLVDSSRVEWQNRAHFFAVAAKLMRRILVDLARKRAYQKRGGSFCRVPFEESLVSTDFASDVVALDASLIELEKVDARKSQVVELRFFAGLSLKETAHVLNISTDTVARDWSAAKAWLVRDLKRSNR
jgi:RNA polymerase sigma-70 factor, ECF subfamily